MTTVKSFLDSPSTTPEQRVRFAILCAMEVYSDPQWRQWAEKWLSGEDRSKKSAEDACDATWAAEYATWAEYYATWAAYYAAWAARYATRAADYATRAADYATRAADYATRAAERAEKARQTEVEEEAKKWAPEGWEEVYGVWYKERQIDFEGLIEKARAVDPLKEI